MIQRIQALQQSGSLAPSRPVPSAGAGLPADELAGTVAGRPTRWTPPGSSPPCFIPQQLDRDLSVARLIETPAVMPGPVPEASLQSLEPGQRQQFLALRGSLEGALLQIPGMNDSLFVSDCLDDLLHHGTLLTTDSTGQTLLANLDHLRQMETCVPQKVLLSEVIAHLARPSETLVQGDHNTCGSMPLSFLLAHDQPAEFARLVRGAASPAGFVSFRGGAGVARPEDAVPEDQSYRTNASRLLQSALMNLVASYQGATYSNAHDRMASKAGPHADFLVPAYTEVLGGEKFEMRDHLGVDRSDAQGVTGTLRAGLEETPLSGLPVGLRWGQAAHGVLVTSVTREEVIFKNSWSLGHGQQSPAPSHRSLGDGREALSHQDFAANALCYLMPEGTATGQLPAVSAPERAWIPSLGAGNLAFMEQVCSRLEAPGVDLVALWREELGREGKSRPPGFGHVVLSGFRALAPRVGAEGLHEAMGQLVPDDELPMLGYRPLGEEPRVPRTGFTDREFYANQRLLGLAEDLIVYINREAPGPPCRVDSGSQEFCSGLIATLGHLSNYEVQEFDLHTADPERVKQALRRGAEKGQWTIVRGYDKASPEVQAMVKAEGRADQPGNEARVFLLSSPGDTRENVHQALVPSQNPALIEPMLRKVWCFSPEGAKQLHDLHGAMGYSPGLFELAAALRKAQPDGEIGPELLRSQALEVYGTHFEGPREELIRRLDGALGPGA